MLWQDPSPVMLSYLQMDHYQIQSLILEKLRDPLESESLKVELIEFVVACVEHQNGMLAAFFDLKYNGKNSYYKDNLNSYISDYLNKLVEVSITQICFYFH